MPPNTFRPLAPMLNQPFNAERYVGESLKAMGHGLPTTGRVEGRIVIEKCRETNWVRGLICRSLRQGRLRCTSDVGSERQEQYYPNPDQRKEKGRSPRL